MAECRYVACGFKVKGDVWSTGNFRNHCKQHEGLSAQVDAYLKSKKGSNDGNGILKTSNNQQPIRNFLAPIDENKVFFEIN